MDAGLIALIGSGILFVGAMIMIISVVVGYTSGTGHRRGRRRKERKH